MLRSAAPQYLVCLRARGSVGNGYTLSTQRDVYVGRDRNTSGARGATLFNATIALKAGGKKELRHHDLYQLGVGRIAAGEVHQTGW